MKTRNRKSQLHLVCICNTAAIRWQPLAVHAQDNSNARISITSEGQASQRSDLRNNEGSLDELEASDN